MKSSNYEFRFGDRPPMDGVEDTFLMSVVAAEGIHGRARVRLDSRFNLDHDGRVCTVNSDNQVGEDIARIFAEFLLLEFGEDGFEVKRDVETHRGCHPLTAARGRS